MKDSKLYLLLTESIYVSLLHQETIISSPLMLVVW